jgi:DNA-binding CsgD family transcriptional regulator
MSAFALTLYIFLLGIGLLTIGLSNIQYKKYHQRFYLFFIFFLIASFIFGFINYFGRFIAKNILSEHDISNFTRNVIDLLLNGIALPFCLVGLYFFILFIREMLKQKKSVLLKNLLILLGVVMILLLIADYIQYIRSSGKSLSDFIRVSLAAVNIIFVLANYFAISQIFFYQKEITNKDQRKTLCYFAVLVIILDSVYFLFLYKILVPQFFYYIVPSVFFISPLIQLLFIKKYLGQFYISHPLFYKPKMDLSSVYKTFGITEREKEIIELICQGKSNREIQEALYISLQTIKNYIYNIYQKLNVRNRVELTNLISQLSRDADNECNI